MLRAVRAKLGCRSAAEPPWWLIVGMDGLKRPAAGGGGEFKDATAVIDHDGGWRRFALGGHDRGLAAERWVHGTLILNHDAESFVLLLEAVQAAHNSAAAERALELLIDSDHDFRTGVAF